MSKKKSNKTIGDLFRLADERGIEVPVLLSFDSEPRAATVYAALAGRPLPADTTSQNSADLVHAVDEAATALRAHAGLGGLVANLLEAPPEPVVRWLLCFTGNHIGVVGYVSKRAGYRAVAYYDQLPYGECCPHCTKELRKGTVVMFVGGTGARETALRFTTSDPTSVARIAALARIVAERRLPSVRHSTEDWEFPVRGAELATILSQFYSDAPGLVAELVRALRQARHPGHQWLLNTLRTATGLGKLAKKVDRLAD